MASVEESNSLRFASDELPDLICRPCERDGVDKEANYYCQDCREYLCEACKDFHRKVVTIMDHKIVSVSKLPVVSPTRKSDLAIFCVCKKNQKVEFFCEDHRDVVCSPCKTFQHHKCKTTSIQQKSSDYNFSSFHSVLGKAKTLKDKYERIKQESNAANKELKRSKQSCIKQIKTFRKEFDTFFDILEQNMLTELDRRGNETEELMDKVMSTITTILIMLETDCKLLDSAKTNCDTESMLTADTQVSKHLDNYETILGDLEKDFVKPNLSFERNMQLSDLQRNITSLGSVTAKHKSGLGAFKTGNRSDKVFLDRNVQSRSEVYVRTRDDSCFCYITGCSILSDGYVVLCDYNNNELKLFDSSWAFTESLKLSSPWDVSVVDDNNVIVTSPDNKQLQYVQIFPHMTTGRVIQLDKKCWGVHVCRDKIYTACHDCPSNGEVRVLDMNGKYKRRLGVHQDGSFMFICPYYITVNASGRKVFISDNASCTITCMKTSGEVIYNYKDQDMADPRGLYCDTGDNILVSGGHSHNVQVITAGGRKNRTLLSSSDGLNSPSPIAYRATDDTLVIACDNKVLLFQLIK